MPLTHKEFALIKKLTSLNGVSGREQQIKDFLYEKYSELGYEILFDNLGSIIAYKKSKKHNAKKVLVDAHMDEVGFLVGKLISKNTYTLINIGYIGPNTIDDASVDIHEAGVPICKGKVVAVDTNYQLICDNNDLTPGLMVTFDTELTQVDEDYYLAKAYDDRFGIALGLELLEYLKDKELDFDLYVSSSVREEVGLKGAITIANLVKPDLAIVLDCSRASDLFGHIGEGVLIRFYDPAMMSFEDLIDYQVKTFKKNNVNFQYFTTGGGTNAGAIHTSNIGVRTLTNCVCAIDIHTNKTIFSGNDYQQAKKGLFSLIDNLDEVL